MSEKLPVFAVVPNYNMGESLQELIPTLLQGGYDEVHIMDDASTDNSRDVIAGFGNDVGSVLGQENRGSAYNRNRILGVLGREAILHFIDADMIIETAQPAEKARTLMEPRDIGFVGGLIKSPDGLQHAFNFGPRHCLYTDIYAALQDYIARLSQIDRDSAAKLSAKYEDKLKYWPNLFKPPRPCRVYWAAESNLVIPSAVLEKADGFDPNLRDHEISDLAIRLDKLGLKRGFDPAISAIHQAVQVRTGNRLWSLVKAQAVIAKKHKYRNYFCPDGKFKPELEVD